jgi:hypothetical protein
MCALTPATVRDGFKILAQVLFIAANDERATIQMASTKSFRLQKREIFERIPLTAEVTVCARGGPVLRLPCYRWFFSALRDSQWGSGKKECAGEEALYR